MLIDQSGIVFGEDALSTYYSIPNDTNSSLPTSSSSSPPSSEVPERPGSVLDFFRFHKWFGLGVKDRRNSNSKEIDGELANQSESNRKCAETIEKRTETSLSASSNDEKETDEFWWDADMEYIAESVPPRRQKNTPHLKKVLHTLPPQVRKSVRFDLNLKKNTTEYCKNPFAPLHTSTPKAAEEYAGRDETDDEANIAPRLNNTSSILLNNASIMGIWDKSRHQSNNAIDLALDEGRANGYYKICFDADDVEIKKEEEDEEPLVATESSESPMSYSGSENLQNEENDVSTDPSVELDDFEESEHVGIYKINDGRQENVSAAFEDSCWAVLLDAEDGSFGSEEL